MRTYELPLSSTTLVLGLPLEEYPPEVQKLIVNSFVAHMAFENRKYAQVTRLLEDYFSTILQEEGFEGIPDPRHEHFVALQRSYDALVHYQSIMRQDAPRGCAFARLQKDAALDLIFQKEYYQFQQLFQNLVWLIYLTDEQREAYLTSPLDSLQSWRPATATSPVVQLDEPSPPLGIQQAESIPRTPSKTPASSPIVPETPVAERYRSLYFTLNKDPNQPPPSAGQYAAAYHKHLETISESPTPRNRNRNRRSHPKPRPAVYSLKDVILGASAAMVAASVASKVMSGLSNWIKKRLGAPTVDNSEDRCRRKPAARPFEFPDSNSKLEFARFPDLRERALRDAGVVILRVKPSVKSVGDAEIDKAPKGGLSNVHFAAFTAQYFWKELAVLPRSKCSLSFHEVRHADWSPSCVGTGSVRELPRKRLKHHINIAMFFVMSFAGPSTTPLRSVASTAHEPDRPVAGYEAETQEFYHHYAGFVEQLKLGEFSAAMEVADALFEQIQIFYALSGDRAISFHFQLDQFVNDIKNMDAVVRELATLHGCVPSREAPMIFHLQYFNSFQDGIFRFHREAQEFQTHLTHAFKDFCQATALGTDFGSGKQNIAHSIEAPEPGRQWSEEYDPQMAAEGMSGLSLGCK
ncbi:hypothetical protein F4604DRAFT_1676362 [Suillus subluteus]|nr:hypothetical protein F4604DRAFT_1676362 [Suillus subluteus]